MTLVMVLREFDFSLDMKPEEVGIYTGATIHTRNGLNMKVKRRIAGKAQQSLGDDVIAVKI